MFYSQTKQNETKNPAILSMTRGNNYHCFFQPKPTINQPNVIYEHKKGSVADKIMGTPSPENATPFFALKPNITIQKKCTQCKEEEKLQRKEHEQEESLQLKSINEFDIQRKCAECEEEEKKKIMRKETGGNISAGVTPAVEQTLHSAGEPIDKSTQNFMESRFGYDFSNVRIHNDSLAHQSSTEINAKAYTSGSNIVFNKNQYSPHTESGKRLLGHELTHVLQQNTSSLSSIQRESIYEDVANVSPTHPGGVYTGTVDRYEYNDKAAYNARISRNRRNTIYHGTVSVSFDSNRCELDVPVNVQFANHTASSGINTTCGDINGKKQDPVKPVSTSAFNSAVSNIMKVLPDGLNNWFRIRIGNSSAVPGCTSPYIPIRVIVNQVNSNPDYTIVITANNGRSYVSGSQNQMVLCGSDVSSDETIIHEGGHFILGHGDEYHEDQASRPRSRERLGQYSKMAQDAPARLQAFYRRHFNFAVQFMNSAFPNCQASLKEGTKGHEIEYSLQLNEGLFSTSELSTLYFSLGTQFGIPITKMRKLSLALGPNLTYLLNSSSSTDKYKLNSLMLGFRLGLNYRSGSVYTRLGNLGFTAGIHVEGGELLNFADNAGQVPKNLLTPYAEVGGYAGTFIDSRWFFGFEGASGVISSEVGNPDIDYTRIGFRAAYSF